MAVLAECCCSTYFYPRPPRGGRRERIIFAPAIDRFLSTPSARRATPKNKKSPDAPNDFYTRPPRGGRLAGEVIDHAEKAFLSTPSARRATWPCWRSVAARPISIHALREEGDGKESSSPQPSTDFYPRPPRGGRPPKIKNPPMLQTISIHALREEGDPKPDHEWPGIHVISIHALREEGDQSFQFAMQTVK